MPSIMIVKLSLYTDYHLASESSFASALAVSATQKKDIVAGNATIAASEKQWIITPLIQATAHKAQTTVVCVVRAE